MYHDFNIYKKIQNTASFDIADLPILKKHRKFYTLLRTEVNMTDFVDFIGVDIHDQVRDNTTEDPVDIEQLGKINNQTVVSKVQLRRYLGKYFPERIHITGHGPVKNNSASRDTNRYYWSAKMAKDFIIFTGKQDFTY